MRFGGFEYDRQFGFSRPEPRVKRPLYDFRGGTLPSGVTLTRASTGTYVDAAGATQTAAIDAARFETVSGVPCILIEPERENRFLHSSDLSQAAVWALARGSYTGGKFVCDSTADNNHSATQSVASSGVTNTFSARMKAAEITLVFAQLGGTIIRGWRLDTGAVAGVTIGTSTATITALGDGSYRVTITGVSSNTNFNIFLGEGTGASLDITLAGVRTNEGAFISECQMEVGGNATSSIPTGAAAATRSADVAKFTPPTGITQVRYVFDNDTTQLASVTAGVEYTIPTDLNRTRIKTIWGVG